MKRASVRRLHTALEVVLDTIGAALQGSYLILYFDRGIYQNSKERAFDRQLENAPASLPDARALAATKAWLREGVLAEMMAHESERLDAWLDRWFSPGTQERIRATVASLKAKG